LIAPPSAWTIANDPPERTSECSLIGKAGSFSDIGYRKVAIHQERFCAINPAFKEPEIGRYAEALPECAREVTHRYTALARHIAKVDDPVEIVPNHLSGPPHLPRSQSTLLF
jgi:hypothetical protein